ncbi:hypothetical protein D3C72_1469380 [compost metagenome]
MAVDIFEAVKRAIAGRHQFDDTFLRMRGDARRLVEAFPAAEILFHHIGKLAQEGIDTHAQHELHHMIDADEGHDIEVRYHGHHITPFSRPVSGGP